MSDKQDRILDGISKLSDSVSDIKVQLALEAERTKANTENIEKMVSEQSRMGDSLVEHIKRTDLLEAAQAQQSQTMASHNVQLEEALVPIRFAKTFVKLALGVGGIAGAVYGIAKAWNAL